MEEPWSFIWIEFPTSTLGGVQVELELLSNEDKSPERGGWTLPRTSGKGMDATKIRRWSTMKPTITWIYIRTRGKMIQEEVFNFVRAVVQYVIVDGHWKRPLD